MPRAFGRAQSSIKGGFGASFSYSFPALCVPELNLPLAKTSAGDEKAAGKTPEDKKPEAKKTPETKKTPEAKKPEAKKPEAKKTPEAKKPEEPKDQKDTSKKPTFTQKLKDVEGTTGKAARFECVVKGDPTPDVKW